jgi:hypothetical protein
MPAITPTASNASSQLGHHDLQRIEKALLDAILDVRPDNENAVDELLSDPKFTGDRAEVERFLEAAVMDRHSDRNRTLERILGDGIQSPPFAAHA